MKIRKLSSCYELDLEKKDFFEILERDKESLWEHTLSRRLERETKAENVDYDGNFGTNIFYCLDESVNAEAEHEKIYKVVMEYINE